MYYPDKLRDEIEEVSSLVYKDLKRAVGSGWAGQHGIQLWQEMLPSLAMLRARHLAISIVPVRPSQAQLNSSTLAGT